MVTPYKAFKYQTDMNVITPGELGMNGNNLVVKNPVDQSIVTVGNANPSATPVPTLAQNYVEDKMDISSVNTLGANFIFLNGTSFDSMGVGTYEFEESDGRVYGLYGRTNGLAQQVYYSAAFNNAVGMQYTTVPYVPPFLNGSNWQAQCVIGSDLEGFALQLRDTTAGSTASPRYLYVRHGGSLINTASHQYVEITQVVQNYLNSVPLTTVGSVPRVIRVGSYFIIALPDWQQGSLRIAGWNAQDSTYPFTTATLPSSAAAYNPQTFTITTTGNPAGDYSSPQNFPSIFGNSTPNGVNIWRLYDMGTGQVSVPVTYNCPNPINAFWATNLNCLLEGEVDGSGNPFLAVGTFVAPGDAASNSSYMFCVFSMQVVFTAGSAGAYTNAQLNFATVNTPGVDSRYMQPGGPLYIGTNPSNQKPREDVASNPADITTCVNKLPLCGYYFGQNSWSTSPTVSWYYSGVTALSVAGGSAIVRGVSRPAGAQVGSLAAARANKLSMIYPMFNVNQRADFNPVNGSAMTPATAFPSGKLISNYSAHMVAPDLVLVSGNDVSNRRIWAMSQLPANSNITDATYNRGGSIIPGFGPRVAEYLVNLPAPDTTLTTWGCVWPTGMANPKAPVNVQFPALASQGVAASAMNGAGVRLGNWSVSNNVYQPPPVVWNYDANMATLVSQVHTSASNLAKTTYSGFGGGGTLFTELVPVINRSGNGVVFALGIVFARDSAGTTLQAAYFTTPCAISGSTLTLTNTSSISLFGNTNIGTGGVTNKVYGFDLAYGRIQVVYPSDPTGDWYVGWVNVQNAVIAGDAIGSGTFIRFGNGGNVVSFGSNLRSQSRLNLTCSVQHQGLAMMPYRDGTNWPEVDLPIGRYSTSATNTQDDLIASFQAAISNPGNFVSGGNNSQSNNLAEILVLNSINNNFLLQVGSMSGRLNHKQYQIPSSFIDMTTYPQGQYYLYLTDTGAGGIQLQVDSAQRPESATSMYFGSFVKTSTGFSNQTSISEVIRFGTARLTAPSDSQSMEIPGSTIRIGPYNSVNLFVNSNDWQGKQLVSRSSRTNLIRSSQDVSIGVYNKLTFVTNIVASPDGTTTADKLVDINESVANDRYVAFQNIAAVGGSNYTFSVWAKAAERPYLTLRIAAQDKQDGTGYVYGTFDLSQGICASGATAGALSPNAQIIPYPNGWYRCILSGIPNTATNQIFALMAVPPTYTNATNYVAVQGQGVYVWGMQLEYGANATKYIPTSGSPVTVSPDYTLDVNSGQIVMATAPVSGATLSWSGSWRSTSYTNKSIGTGDGSNKNFMVP